MREFGTYHPAVSFVYFTAVFAFSMFFRHPAALAVSFLCGFCCCVFSFSGKTGAFRRTLLLSLPLIAAAALINPAFSHEGATIITYLPGGNPLTAESIVYGAVTGVMLSSVMMWFSCFNSIMTSDKLVYLFGRIAPALSLIFSMTLRFIPRFAQQAKRVAAARKCIGHGDGTNIIKRAKNGIATLSILITWALENAIDTADSMKSRGYGLPGRTAFSIFRFGKRDLAALLYTLFCTVYVLTGSLLGMVDFRYFPTMRGTQLSAYGVSIFAAYFALCVFPIVTELWEERKWKFIRSKI